MPIQVDPEQRRREVIEAVFRLVVDGGVDAASLRRVAAEAGLNIGSVRHYFDSHEDLLAAAQEVGDRMGRRIAQYGPAASSGLEARIRSVQVVIEEVLPLDADRHLEAVVLIEFLTAARTRPVFRPLAERMAKDLHLVVTAVLADAGVAGAGLEADRLVALVGGLTVDAVAPHGSLTPDRIRQTLRYHLERVLADQDMMSP